MSPDAIVVGGGIAGLAAAYELTRRDIACVLFERSPAMGGVIVNEQLDGFTIDAGPDALLIQKPDAVQLCRELGLGDRLVSTLPPRLAYIQRGGRLYPLPAASVLGVPTRIGPFLRSRLFSWPGKVRMGAELFVPPRREAGDESIGAFMRRRFGREATIYLAEPLLAGIHAGDVDRLSVGALFPRFSDAEREHGSLIRAFRRRREPPAAEGAFQSLRNGLGELVGALVASLPQGTVETRATVARIVRVSPAGGFRVELAGRPPRASRAVILTTPAYVTATLLHEHDAEIERQCAAIPYSSVATIALAFRRAAVAHPLNGSGFVVPRVEGSGILAATWLSSKWPNRAPDGMVLVRTFVGGARDPGALEATDATLVDRSLSALRPVLGIAGDPLFARVYRFERATAQHEVGHLDRVKAIDRRLADHPGLFVTGSGFRGVGIPDCIADARATAARVAGWITQAGATSASPDRRSR